jgi:hypothetical protein
MQATIAVTTSLAEIQLTRCSPLPSTCAVPAAKSHPSAGASRISMKCPSRSTALIESVPSAVMVVAPETTVVTPRQATADGACAQTPVFLWS